MTRVASLLLMAMGFAAADAAMAATVTLVPGAGFSDTTPATPEGGNSGVTLGEQRTILFNAAGAAWGRALTSSQVIRISAAFTSEFCDPTSAVLGAAGATAYGARAFSGQSRWIPVALLEALASADANAGAADINAVFNATLDTASAGCLGGTRWYYGLVGPVPAGTIALYPTVMHEIGHGLGFASLLCEDPDGCSGTAFGGYFSARPDRWSDFVRDNGAAKLWVAMTDAERATSFTRDPLLVWNGASVNGRLAAFGQDGSELNGGFMRMYAPATYEPGSSVSHFHEDANPNLLMEPSADSDVFLQTDLSDCLLADMGWTNTRCNDTAPSFTALSNVTINEDATQVVSLAGLAVNGAGQSLSIVAVSGDERLLPDPAVTYTSPQATGSVLLAPVANASGSAVVVVYANDSAGSSTPRSFTLTVTSQNDAPVLDASKSPALPAVAEDSGAPSGAVGALVSALVDYASPSGQVDNVTDVDTSPAPLLGIAVVAADGSNGTWRYSTNNGSNWLALGSPAESSARLLAADANSRLHFAPNANFSGSATVTFRAWDRTTGTAGNTINITASGGITAFSSVTDAIGATVTNNNDPPTSSAPAAVNGTEDVATTFTAGNALSLADTDGGTLTVTLAANRGALTLSTTGLSFTTGDGSADATMTFSGTIAALNTALASLSHAPTADYNGSASVTFTVSDGVAAAVVKNITLNLAAIADIGNDTVTTNEDTALVFNAITGTGGATADAFENAGRAVTAVTQGTNGTASFAADGTLTYTPGANFNGNDTFTYTVTSGGVTETATVSVTVSAVNDPPTASNLSAAETYTEDTTRALFDIIAADVESATLTATLTLSNPAAGALTTTTASGVTSNFDAGTGVWTANGSVAGVNAVLAAVEFVPATNFNSNFAIATSVSDGVLAVTGSKALAGIAVNDPPGATNLSAAESYTEDTPLALVDIVVTDVDSGTLTATMTLSTPAAGALSTTTASGVTSTYNAVTGVWSANGSVAGVNAVVAAVSFVPAAHFNANFNIATSVSDGALAAAGNKAMTGTAVDDVPGATNLSAAETYSEDTTLALTDIVASDPDSATLTATLTLSAPAAGMLTTTTAGGVTSNFNAGTGVWTATGSVAGVNAVLAAVAFVPATDFNASFTVATSVSDGTLAVTGNKVVTGIPSNDAPSAANLSVAESYTEDATIALSDILAADVDSATLTATLVLSTPAAGLLTTTTASGVTSAYNAGTGTWTANGSAVGVNAVLADVAFVPAANFNANFTIATSVSDGALAVTGNKAITGTAVNDAPTSVVNPIIAGSEDSVVSFTAGNAISVADVDGGALRVSIGAGSGAFTLGSTTGLAFTTGDGTADASMVFDGTQAALNAALATLTYAPPADFNGGVGLTTAVDDLMAPAVSKGTALVLNAVADLVNDSITTARNTPASFNVITGAGGANADSFENAGRTLSAVGTPANGDVVFTATGSVTYTPDTGFEGNDSFSYTVSSGGVDETGSVGIAVVPPSAMPQATNLSAPETYNEDTALDLIDIVVSDDSASLNATVTLSPASAGALSTGNAGGVTSVYDAGSGGWFVSGSVAQLNAQLAALQFVPAAESSANATLTVNIADEGTSASGTKVLAGLAVNDAPTTSAPAGVATVEDVDFAFTAANALHAGDIDSASIAVALAVDRGTLTLGVTTGLAFSVGDGNSDAAVTFMASPANAEAALASLRHVPTPDYNGAATLAFSTSDGIAAPVARNVALATAAVADAADDSVGTFENTAISFNVLTGANGASPDAFEGPATVIAVTQGVIGSVVFAADGSVTYTPASGQSGNDGFTYTVLAGGVSETANVSVAVGDVNAAPAFDAIANPAAIAANAAAQVVNVTGISAGPGEAQALVLTATSDNALLIPNPAVTYTSPQATGTLAYTPVAGAFGTAIITVILRDNGGTAGGGVDTFVRTFTVTVVPGTPLIFRNGFEGN